MEIMTLEYFNNNVHSCTGIAFIYIRGNTHFSFDCDKEKAKIALLKTLQGYGIIERL